MTSRRSVATVGIVVVFALAASDALAQGNGNAYGHSKNRPGAAAQPSAAGAPELQTVGISTLSFGSWLDDASVIPQGGGTMSVAFSYWRTPSYREVDVPVIDGGVGIAPRVQFNFNVPYYHAGDSDGTVVRGIGDMYVSTKIQLKDPSAGDHRIGFALTPLLEILTYAPAAGRVTGELGNSGQRGATGAIAGARSAAPAIFRAGALFASGARRGRAHHSYGRHRNGQPLALNPPRRAEHRIGIGAEPHRCQRSAERRAQPGGIGVWRRRQDHVEAGCEQLHACRHKWHGFCLRGVAVAVVPASHWPDTPDCD